MLSRNRPVHVQRPSQDAETLKAKYLTTLVDTCGVVSRNWAGKDGDNGSQRALSGEGKDRQGDGGSGFGKSLVWYCIVFVRV